MISVLLVLTSFAALAETQTPAWAGAVDTSISVSGLQVGDTVKFYQVLEYDQTAKTTGGWKFTTAFAGLTPDNLNQILGLGDYATGKNKAAQAGITAALAGEIASQITSTTAVSYTKENIATTIASQENPAAGLYVAIIEPAAGTNTIYNPVFVGADYYTNTSNGWTVTTNMTYADNAMAKKDSVEVTKTAAEKAEDTNETHGAKSVGKGDWINFEITTNIPLFADNYTRPLFVVTDTMTSGLAYKKTSVHVYESDGTTEITATKDNKTQFTLDTTSDTQYKITFDPTYLKGLTASKPIVIKYEAQVTEDAVENVHEEDNTVTVEYSHKPDVTQEGQGKKLRDKTHHYTYTIDGNIWGDSSYKSTEVVKVGIDKDGNEITETHTLANGHDIGALANAEFKLYKDNNGQLGEEYNKGAYAAATETANGNKIVSDAEGRLKLNGSSMGIPGLDAGTYWLREELAPAGYIKQLEPVKIEIIPTYYDTVTWTDTDGVQISSDDVLKSYIVKVNGVQTAEYVLHYTYLNGKTESDADRVPANDTCSQDGQNMKTTAGDIVIGNSGPITIVEGQKQDSDAYGKIQNTRGVELPSTGGMGTTILYIGGSILVILAAVLLITKRRMNAED